MNESVMHLKKVLKELGDRLTYGKDLKKEQVIYDLIDVVREKIRILEKK